MSQQSEILVVEYDEEDRGNYRHYFRVISVNGTPVKGKLFICSQEDYPGVVNWYTVSDNKWREPDNYVKASYQIQDVTGAVLKEVQTVHQ